VGPAVSYFLLSFLRESQGALDTTMYTAFTAFAAVGVILLLTLRKPSLADQNSIQGSQPSAAAGQRHTLAQEVCGPLLRVLQLCLKRDIALMLSACFFIGIEMSFVTGEFFRLTMLLPCYYADSINSSASGTANETLCAEDEATATCMWDVERQACTKDPSVVGLVFIAFGLGDCIGAFVLGLLSDGSPKGGTPLRRKLVVTLGALCYGGALALLVVFKNTQHEILPRFPPKAWLPQEERSLSWMCFIIAALFGVNDAAWNTQMYAALMSAAPKDGVHVFTIYQMLQQLGMVTGFCMPLIWPLESS
jgi:MFS family permease